MWIFFLLFRLEVQERKNSVSKELEDYKLDNQRFMQEMNNTITQGKQDHIALSNEVTLRATYCRKMLHMFLQKRPKIL